MVSVTFRLRGTGKDKHGRPLEEIEFVYGITGDERRSIVTLGEIKKWPALLRGQSDEVYLQGHMKFTASSDIRRECAAYVDKFIMAIEGSLGFFDGQRRAYHG